MNTVYQPKQMYLSLENNAFFLHVVSQNKESVAYNG